MALQVSLRSQHPQVVVSGVVSGEILQTSILGQLPQVVASGIACGGVLLGSGVPEQLIRSFTLSIADFLQASLLGQLPQVWPAASSIAKI